jgi:N-methylhydantoinase A
VKTALITSEGFRDILEIGRGNRPDYFNLNYVKPKPFVPRYLRRVVPGRINYKGVETKPLDLTNLPDILNTFREEGVEAIAVCLINSYANSSHEETVVAEIEKLWPEVSGGRLLSNRPGMA